MSDVEWPNQDTKLRGTLFAAWVGAAISIVCAVMVLSRTEPHECDGAHLELSAAINTAATLQARDLAELRARVAKLEPRVDTIRDLLDKLDKQPRAGDLTDFRRFLLPEGQPVAGQYVMWDGTKFVYAPAPPSKVPAQELEALQTVAKAGYFSAAAEAEKYPSGIIQIPGGPQLAYSVEWTLGRPELWTRVTVPGTKWAVAQLW